MRKRRRDERQRWAPSELDVPPTMHQHGRAMELSNATRWLCCRVSRSLRTVSPPIQYHADVAVVVCRPPSLAGGRSLLFLGGSGWRCCSRAGSRGAGGRYGVAFRPLMRAAIGQDQKRSSPIRRRRREPPAPSSPHSPLRATCPGLPCFAAPTALGHNRPAAAAPSFEAAPALAATAAWSLAASLLKVLQVIVCAG